MKARYLTQKETRAAKTVAKQIIEQELDDVALRAQMILCASALNIGLSARTVNRMLAAQTEVQQEYGELRKDAVADFGLWKALTDKGVVIEKPRNEL